MSLADQVNLFKNKLKDAPTVTFRKTVEKRPADPRPDEGAKRKREKTTTVYSQPSNTGVGTHQSTQIHHAMEYLKKQDRPVKVSDLEGYLSLLSAAHLVAILRHVPRVHYNVEAQTLEYIPQFNIRSDDALLSFLRRQPTFKGVSVKELKDGWSGCIDAIDRLEKSGQIFVLRTKKENNPRFVWANALQPVGFVDEEFVQTWQTIKLPSPADLPARLEAAGLKPTSVDPATIKKDANKSSERKQKKPRRGKITNTHLRGVLKDFSSSR